MKFLLNNLSQVYEDKVRKTTFNNIERLMDIIKAKNKSIYIEKNYASEPERVRSYREQNKEVLEEIKKSENQKNETEASVQTVEE